MRRFVSLMLVLMLVFSAYSAVAESEADPLAANVEEEVAQPYAYRTVMVTGQWKTVYECPVRQKHIMVTFNSSEGPGAVYVKLYAMENGQMVDEYGPKRLTINDSWVVDMTIARKYEITVIKDEFEKDGNCRFTILASS